MRTKEYLVLFLLAALCGASFLFIKVAVADMSPLTLVFIRLAIGALGLLLFVPFNPKIMQGWHTTKDGTNGGSIISISRERKIVYI